MPDITATLLSAIPLNTPTNVKMGICQENNTITLTKQSDDGVNAVILLTDTLTGASHTETRLSSTSVAVLS